MNTKQAESKTFPILSDANYKKATAVRRAITRKMNQAPQSYCGLDCGCWKGAPMPTCTEFHLSALRAEEWARMLPIYADEFGADAAEWMKADGLRDE